MSPSTSKLLDFVIQMNRFAVLAQGLDSEVCFVLRVLVEQEPHEGVQMVVFLSLSVDVEVVDSPPIQDFIPLKLRSFNLSNFTIVPPLEV